MLLHLESDVPVVDIASSSLFLLSVSLELLLLVWLLRYHCVTLVDCVIRIAVSILLFLARAITLVVVEDVCFLQLLYLVFFLWV